jgi:GNAT superfamily N-acetyltransferase
MAGILESLVMITSEQSAEIQISNTSLEDWDRIVQLFDGVIEHQGKSSYRVWESIDWDALREDIEKQLHYKITVNGQISCIFNVQYSDPLLWGEKENNDAIYLHRIVIDLAFKGQKQFAKVLEWAKQDALQRGLKFVRLDTWADNAKIIDYYNSYGFIPVGHYQTSDSAELPIQNRNLYGILLEISL